MIYGMFSERELEIVDNALLLYSFGLSPEVHLSEIKELNALIEKVQKYKLNSENE